MALLGVGDLPNAQLSEGAIWDRSDGAITGRSAIQTARTAARPCRSIRVDQVVSHGKAGTASGVVRRDGESPRLFCHVIRFAASNGGKIVQIVSFEHAGGKHDR